MREKLRERNLEPLELPWQTMKRRRKPNQNPLQAIQTCFANNLPLTSNSSEIANLFKTHGAIDYIYIPAIKEHSSTKYAFVRFQYPQSLPTTIRDENGRIVGSNRITVFPAKMDKPPPTNHKPPKRHLPPPPKNLPRNPQFTAPSIRDSRTYKEAANNQNKKNPSTPPPNPPTNLFSLIQNPITFPYENQIFEKPNISTPNPSKHRIMSSRVLGEETEEIRNSLGAIDLNGDYAASLKGSKCEENKEWLQQSVIGVASSSQSPRIIMEGILANGVNYLSTKSMGGMMHLITFNTLEDKVAMLESTWLDQWYLALRDVDKKSASLWRETWIKVYGVPLMC